MWAAGNYCSFDTETTGFGSRARVLEIGLVVFENFLPVHEWSTLLCPEDVDWDNEHVKQAMFINKIDPDSLRGQPTFAQALPNILLELSHDTLVAHNASFDMGMMGQELSRAGVPLLTPKMVVCTKILATKLGGGSGNRLQDVAPRFGVVQESAHRAVVDARVCGLVFAAMLRTGRLPVEDAPMAQYMVSRR